MCVQPSSWEEGRPAGPCQPRWPPRSQRTPVFDADSSHRVLKSQGRVLVHEAWPLMLLFMWVDVVRCPTEWSNKY